MLNHLKIFFISFSLFIIGFFSISFKINAQQKSVFTQYMFNGLAINPAYAGSQNILNATVFYRKQWVGVEGAPNTQTASIHSSTKKKRVGLGIFIMRDEIGVHSDLNLYASYSYKIKVSRKAILSMGVQGGFNNLKSNYDKLNIRNPGDPVFQSDNKWSPNFGAGLYYYVANKAYVGFSVPYIIKSSVLPKDLDAIGRQARYYLLTAGYLFPLSPDLKFKPSTLIRMEEGAPLGMDLNSTFILKEFIFLGYSYRSSDSMSFLAQIQLNPNFQIGYAYDLTVSSLAKHSKGSHEFLLNYRINLFPEKCATYF
ncbi:MAG TPA: type IX secretion system membrane protein PorP/SprF [Cytophagales bacterium]|nr:type IX secretion system membrane protein PorP/SprF [Cytophagales bacterium]